MKLRSNTYTVSDVSEKGFDPIALRYLYLQTHYRQEMNFTWDSLDASQIALNKLREEFLSWEEAKIGCAEYEETFHQAINDDLNIPKALSIVWDMVKSDYPTSAKKQSILKFDEVLGLGLGSFKKKEEKIPEEIKKLSERRENLRKEGEFDEADKIREEIVEKGFIVEDFDKGSKIKRKS